MTPSTKVSSATLAAALGTILVWLLGTYGHLELPEAVQAALVALLTLVVGYLVPETNPAPSAIATIHERGA